MQGAIIRSFCVGTTRTVTGEPSALVIVGAVRARGEQGLHVAAAAADAEQTGLAVDDAGERASVVAGHEQVEQHARVEVAGAGAHHQAAGRGW